jgi:hypothetical protein
MNANLVEIIVKYEAELAQARLAGEPEDWGFPVSKRDLRALIGAAKELSMWDEIMTPESVL